MERIGIYGGTFNPPHLGHMLAAAQSVKLLHLDRLLLIPDRIAPHKVLPEGSASPEQRLQMLRLAIQDTPGLELCTMELDRGGISYTCDTVAQLRAQYPDAELILFMGTDMFLSFDSWKNPDLILQNAALAVFYRGDPNEIPKIQEKKALIL